VFFDSHAHLNDRRLIDDREAILAAMAEKRVTAVMNASWSLESSLQSIELAEAYPFIWAAVGSHPDHADEVDAAVIARYRELAKHPRVMAIGEIGLDYHYEDIRREIQQDAFRRQLELAAELKLPVIVHERDAHEDGLRIVEEFPEVRGVFHCFSGSWELAKELLKRGWYLGFTGVLTFKNARKAVEVASNAPLDRLLIETDCPYMTPEPFRGRRNDSSYVSLVGAKLAELRGISVEEAAKATFENAARLFGIEQ